MSRFSTFFSAIYLLTSGATAAGLNISGDLTISRNWDCCKPSCSWKYKAEVNQPVQACGINGNPVDPDAGSGCNDGGTAYQCPSQQPWAVNDTFAYGFGGAFLRGALTDGKLEEAWCCACYQIDFTDESLKGKRMIVQATNTLYDKTDKNRFSLSIPGGNFSIAYAGDTCNTQYGLPAGSYNHTNFGVNSRDECNNVPEALRKACQWRFDWYTSLDFANGTFKRVSCPVELTNRSTCTRNDEKQLAQGSTASLAVSLSPALSIFLVAGLMGLLLM